jgi:ubiquitin carboxyl-terminal hydrolase 5/13
MHVVPPMKMDLSYVKIPRTLEEGERGQDDHCDVTQGIPDDLYLSASEELFTLLKMGFGLPKAKWALKKANNSVAEVIRLFSDRYNAYYQGETLEEIEGEDEPAPHPTDVRLSDVDVVNGPGGVIYHLVAIISHVGDSPISGHYVCHIRKPKSTVTSDALNSAAHANGNDEDDHCWVSYNDEKVGVTTKPPFDYASLYFYSRVA